MMNFRALLTVILVPILIFQLAAVEFTFDFRDYQYGEILPITLGLYRFGGRSLTPHPAVLTSHNEGTYDQLVFVGDVMLGRHVEMLAKKFGSTYPFEGLDLKTEFGSEAAIVGNFESAMNPDHKMTPAFKMQFSVEKSNAHALGEVGFTHLSLANNHSFDYGALGYQHAIEVLEDTGIKTFGQQKGVNENSLSYIDMQHGTVALIGINVSNGFFDEASVRTLIEKSAEYSQLQIAYIHWGIEYDLVHHPSQTAIAETLVDAGADLIVGHHPHVVQDVGIIDGVPVVYSLGNYVFDQYFSTDVQEGLIAVVEFDPLPQVKLLPISSQDSISQPRLMVGDERAEFLYKLAKRSDEQAKNSLAKGYVALYNTVASSTKIAMMRR